MVEQGTENPRVGSSILSSHHPKARKGPEKSGMTSKIAMPGFLVVLVGQTKWVGIQPD